jgi:Glycosyl hydrolases family 16
VRSLSVALLTLFMSTTVLAELIHGDLLNDPYFVRAGGVVYKVQRYGGPSLFSEGDDVILTTRYGFWKMISNANDETADIWVEQIGKNSAISSSIPETITQSASVTPAPAVSTVTPTPSATPTPAPTPMLTPVAGIQPSITLPGNYTLAWNQDFGAASYSPFNTAANVSTAGPPTSIWRGLEGIASGNAYVKFNGTEGDPFSTSQGYLVIHSNGSPPAGTNPYGGEIRSCSKSLAGFQATNAYWEAKMRLPYGGGNQWPAFWLISFTLDPVTNQRGEIDISEWGYQIPGTTNGASQVHLHLWPGGESASDYEINSLSVTPDGWHIFGCLIQPGTVSIYLDSNLVHTFIVSSAFNTPMEVILDNVFGPGFPTGGCTSGDLACQYIRCWTPQ